MDVKSITFDELKNLLLFEGTSKMRDCGYVAYLNFSVHEQEADSGQVYKIGDIYIPVSYTLYDAYKKRGRG